MVEPFGDKQWLCLGMVSPATCLVLLQNDPKESHIALGEVPSFGDKARSKSARCAKLALLQLIRSTELILGCCLQSLVNKHVGECDGSALRTSSEILAPPNPHFGSFGDPSKTLQCQESPTSSSCK